MGLEQDFNERLKKVQRLTPDCTYRVDYGLLHIPRFIEQYGVDLDPDYQRHYCWTKTQKKLFVGAAIQNHNAIPIFWFNFGPKGSSEARSEVVDGKQRLNAILEWLDNKFPAVCPCGESFWARDIDEYGERNLGMYTTLRMHFVKLSRPDVLNFYINLNSGGTVHSKMEIERVRALLVVDEARIREEAKCGVKNNK